MNKQPTEDTTFLAGLHEFWDTDFPKTCLKCSRIYHTFSEFIDGCDIIGWKLVAGVLSEFHECSVGAIETKTRPCFVQ